ncbi:MAG: TonB-dependent receptor [Parvularculaceae bacterium]|nr:TonB-dependent receptor [Parvularculaceae bacterium]
MRNKSILSASASILVLLSPSLALAQEDVGRDEIIVTASPLERSVAETVGGVTVLSGEDLQRNLESSIGETLRRQPGISSTFFGPGASRPVIRGLGGDRISILDSGIGSNDASATSVDHAVAIEPATAERIEIVRGAATLLYGSSAAGGVVNVFSGRIPSALPEGGADGALRVGLSSVDDGVEAAGGFDVTLAKFGGGGLVFHGEGGYRNAENYEIPGFAHSARRRAIDAADPMGPGADTTRDVLPSSSSTSKTGSAGVSLVFDNGFAGISGTAIDSLYSIPGSEEALPDGTGPSIDLRQRRLDFDSAFEADLGLFSKAKLRVGYADYTHTEFEPDGAAGTVFANEGVEGRLELVDKTVNLGSGALNGAVGFQFRVRDFEAIGDEAFLPGTDTSQYGIFALKEYSQGPLRFEVGGRFEKTSHKADDIGADLDFNAYSVTAGVSITPAEGLFFGVTGLRTERAPSPEELFSDGLHLATGSFEVGDPTLGKETARGVEATARFGTDRFSLTLNGFYTSYKDFIFENATGMDIDIDGELFPVFEYIATDATFKGFEAEIDAELFSAGAVHFHTHLAADYVRATADGSSTGDLPRIPPFSGLFALEARSPVIELRGELDYAGEQDRVGFDELPTDSYTQYNAYLTIRPLGEDSPLALRVSALNLSNEEARLHTSFLKDVAPLPGRNIRVALTGNF